MARREVLNTLLLVGEGRHDAAFIRHATQLFVPRGQNFKVKIKQAGGKGAEHVVDFTCRQLANAHYDQAASLLDTDTDWTAAAKKKAKTKKIILLPADPCLEAMLLRVLGQSATGDSHALKRRFASCVNNDPCDHANYAVHFTRERLLAARQQEKTLDELLKLLRC